MGSNNNFKGNGERRRNGDGWRNGGGKRFAGKQPWKKDRSPSLHECARKRMMDEINEAVLGWQSLGLFGKVCAFALHPLASLVAATLTRLSAESVAKEEEIRRKRKEAHYGA